MADVKLSFWDVILHISNDLILLWQAVNPPLPLISIKAIRRKVGERLTAFGEGY